MEEYNPPAAAKSPLEPSSFQPPKTPLPSKSTSPSQTLLQPPKSSSPSASTTLVNLKSTTPAEARSPNHQSNVSTVPVNWDDRLVNLTLYMYFTLRFCIHRVIRSLRFITREMGAQLGTVSQAWLKQVILDNMERLGYGYLRNRNGPWADIGDNDPMRTKMYQAREVLLQKHYHQDRRLIRTALNGTNAFTIAGGTSNSTPVIQFQHLNNIQNGIGSSSIVDGPPSTRTPFSKPQGAPREIKFVLKPPSNTPPEVNSQTPPSIVYIPTKTPKDATNANTPAPAPSNDFYAYEALFNNPEEIDPFDADVFADAANSHPPQTFPDSSAYPTPQHYGHSHEEYPQPKQYPTPPSKEDVQSGNEGIDMECSRDIRGQRDGMPGDFEGNKGKKRKKMGS